MTQELIERLEPCPFCGEKGGLLAIAADGLPFRCERCGATGPKAFTVKWNWNTRDQSQSARIAELEGEKADLIHDLERQMTIANIECNEAERAKEALRSIEAIGERSDAVNDMLNDALEIASLSLTKDSTSDG